MNEGKIYFRNLDSIRFIAALMVFLGHDISPAYQYLPFKGALLRIFYVISAGGTGVSIFFVLSGFLITYLLVTEDELSGKISVKNFYIRRVLRIWPLYFAVIGFAFLYPVIKSSIGMNNPRGSNPIYYFTFLSNFDVINIEKHCYGQDAMSQSITWSVAIEEQFYAFWPLLFVFLPKRFWITGIITVIAGSLVFRIFNWQDNVVLYFHTLSVLIDLGLGGLMAYTIKTNARVRSFFENTNGWKHLAFFTLSFLLLYFGDQLFSFPYGPAFERLFISLSFAFFIAAQAITKVPSRLNLGNYSFMSRWGKYTYGIYLIHPTVITLLGVAARPLHLNAANFLQSLGFAIVAFAGTLLLSWLSYTFYESKFLKLKDRFTTVQSHE